MMFCQNTIVMFFVRLPIFDRNYEIIIHRLKIGHTYLTHGHLLRRETLPWCLACQVELTVELILLHCVSFTNACDDFFWVIASKVASHSIISFIKETGFYHEI